ncbi:glucoside xylosyltransferase 1-like isoform X2 [Dendronephthya gigantea]|uniref:glucoside xylosyltransferase 1-like isoform X2 n=1 Tax=Dendronephthya gigantea TaxID=151771 RepID=UPI001068EDCC|nr:glucoside xylosyltransferase 1-like isoform X2 [Dendronephthya gigantea]
MHFTSVGFDNGFTTCSITQKDNLGDFDGKKWREQSVLLDTQTSIGNPHGARSLKETDKSVKVSSTTCAPGKTAIDVAAVVCGDRSKEIMNMVKSVLIFTNHQVHFHIVSERDLQEGIKRSFDKFPSNVKEHFGFTLYNLSYPPGENIATWKNLFKTCASQRLFLMDFIKRDKVLYLDTDTLLLSPVEKIWHHFSKFNKTQLAAMTREGELASLNWYHRFARHPFYGKLGLNSGVMLMDLRKLRDLKFTQNIIEIYREHKYNIVWGDQDLLNIYFNKHPDRVYLYPCEWNYRPDHCMYQNNCQSVLRNGVYVLHGNRGVFHNDKQKAFRTVYDAIKKYKFGGNVETDIVAKILNMESLNSDRYCKLMAKSFVKNMLQPNG